MPIDNLREFPSSRPAPATSVFEVGIPGFHLRLEVRGAMTVKKVDTASRYLAQLRADLLTEESNGR